MSTSRQHQGHFARKRFGQNFLVDMGVIDSIVNVIRPQRGERMVEIGPGLGALTEPLIERLATPEAPLHAVELDRDLIVRLKKKFGDLLELHSGDALDFDFGTLAAPVAPIHQKASRRCGSSAICRTTFRARCCFTSRRSRIA